MAQIPCTPVRMLGAHVPTGQDALPIGSDVPVNYGLTDTGYYGSPGTNAGSWNSTVTDQSGADVVTFESTTGFSPVINADPRIDPHAFEKYDLAGIDNGLNSTLPEGFQLTGFYLVG